MQTGNKIMATLLLTAALGGCATTNPYTGQQQTSDTAKGGVLGGVLGTVAGAFAHGRNGAILGGIVGTIAGLGIGHYMDDQDQALRKQLAGTGVQVEKHGDQIRLIMPGEITFPVNESSIRPSFYKVLHSVALVLKGYSETDIQVAGYTDSTGSRMYNQRLSQQRAMAVWQYLVMQGVKANRVEAVGFGERDPIASNATQAGRAKNRRVELTLVPAPKGQDRQVSFGR